MSRRAKRATVWPAAQRQREVLWLLVGRAMSEKQVAAELKISFGRAHQIVVALYRFYDVSTRAELIAHFVGAGQRRALARAAGARNAHHARKAG